MTEPCARSGCYELALLVLPVCDFCQKRYCTTHILPEVHGCGDACRKAAQQRAAEAAAQQKKNLRLLGNQEARQRLAKRLEENEAARRKRLPKCKEKKPGSQ
ncbi:unnamed protein product [Phytomonas sp. EM1]|nr:unnamed protein product [Phytomonas sp. EM1]|eukprot:CCW62359.1 unnamed protein product [Phytomonas sp. isolate EM1]